MRYNWGMNKQRIHSDRRVSVINSVYHSNRIQGTEFNFKGIFSDIGWLRLGFIICGICILENTALIKRAINSLKTHPYGTALFLNCFSDRSKVSLLWINTSSRSKQGIQRYWLIMSLVHYMCCMHSGKYCTFEDGYQYFQNQVRIERLSNLHVFIKNGASLEDVLRMVGWLFVNFNICSFIVDNKK